MPRSRTIMNRRSFLRFLPAVPVGIGAVVSGWITSAEESTVSVLVGGHTASIVTTDSGSRFWSIKLTKPDGSIAGLKILQ